MTNGNGNKGTIVEAFKALLTSPMGGWALAVIAIAIMAYMSFKDRQAMYQDLLHLRSDAMPLIRDDHELIKEVNHKSDIILNMLKDTKDEKDSRISHPNVAP